MSQVNVVSSQIPYKCHRVRQLGGSKIETIQLYKSSDLFQLLLYSFVASSPRVFLVHALVEVG